VKTWPQGWVTYEYPEATYELVPVTLAAYLAAQRKER
jgi:hypothetical protein